MDILSACAFIQCDHRRPAYVTSPAATPPFCTAWRRAPPSPPPPLLPRIVDVSLHTHATTDNMTPLARLHNSRSGFDNMPALDSTMVRTDCDHTHTHTPPTILPHYTAAPVLLPARGVAYPLPPAHRTTIHGRLWRRAGVPRRAVPPHAGRPTPPLSPNLGRRVAVTVFFQAVKPVSGDGTSASADAAHTPWFISNST